MITNLLEGKKGIIFGALNDLSIAWKVAEKAHEQGAEFVLTNVPVSIRMGTINELAEKTNSKVIPADATNIEDLENLIRQTMERFGGLDLQFAEMFNYLNKQESKEAPAHNRRGKLV